MLEKTEVEFLAMNKIVKTVSYLYLLAEIYNKMREK
jgi:hypothetical protein